MSDQTLSKQMIEIIKASKKRLEVLNILKFSEKAGVCHITLHNYKKGHDMKMTTILKILSALDEQSSIS